MGGADPGALAHEVTGAVVVRGVGERTPFRRDSLVVLSVPLGRKNNTPSLYPSGRDVVKNLLAIFSPASGTGGRPQRVSVSASVEPISRACCNRAPACSPRPSDRAARAISSRV